MGRDRISGHAGSAHRPVKRTKRSPGLEVVERGGYWHVHGTIRVAGRSVRIRSSTGLPATAANRADAETARFRIEEDFRNEVLHGIKPSVTIEEASLAFLSRARARPLNEIDVTRITEITVAFKGRRLSAITDADWDDFVKRRMAGRSAATRERYLNILMALLNYAKEKGWVRQLPKFERLAKVRKPKSRKRRRVSEITPDLIAMMIDEAAPHLKPQLAVMWCTGSRVSSVLYGCRFCDVTLAPGREQIVLHKTKTGEDVESALNPWAAQILRDYVLHRGIPKDRESRFFLTHHFVPYTDNHRAWGGQMKTAFNGMKRRVAARLRAQGREAEAELVEQITPHWFRHYVATHLLAKGFDLKTVMAQGGWLRMESVQTYAHTVSERQREAAAALGTVDTTSTQKPDEKVKNGDKSEA